MSDVSDQRRYYEHMIDEIAVEHRQQIDQLEKHSAQLRELVRDTLTTISWCTIDCYPSDNKKRELNARARELGIEAER